MSLAQNEPFDLKQNIITLLGLQALPEDKRRNLVVQMAELVEKRVILRLMETLTDKQAMEAEKMTNKPDQILDFLIKSGADVPAMLREEAGRVKNEVVADAEKQIAADVF
jgi:hypothetical protein